MSASADGLSVLDRIRRSLVGLKMPRALEMLDPSVRRLERGEASALEVIDALLAEELTLRESRRIKTALMMARLSTIKTLAGFDFTFQPSLDRGRILTLAELQFIDRNEVVHLLDRILHHAVVIQIEGSSYRLRQHADLMPEHLRSKAVITPPFPAEPPRRRGPPKTHALDQPAG